MKKTLSVLILFSVAFCSRAQQNQNFNWAVGMEGSGVNDMGLPRTMVTDAAGNVYAGGCFYGTIDFDPGPSAYNLTAGGKSMYICKLDSAGNFLWARAFEPLGGDLSGLGLDRSGNLYATGIGASGLAVIYKYSPAGTMLWSKSLGGISDVGYNLAIDASFNIYTVGIFYGAGDFDPGAGNYTLNSSGSADIFILKLDPTGNFIWARQIGGTGVDLGNDIALDASGNPCITGLFYNTVDFDPGPGTYTLATLSPTSCAFVCKLDTSGNFLWANHFETQVPGGISQGQAIALDTSDNVYVGGSFFDTIDFDPGAGSFPLSSTGDGDVFITKLDPGGNLIWAKHMGGTSLDLLADIQVGRFGQVYSTGTTLNSPQSDFDPGPAVYYLTCNGGEDAFISKLDSAGNFVWAKIINDGGSFGIAISLDNAEGVYIHGSYTGIGDFNTESGTYTLGCQGDVCMFVQKLGKDTTGTTNPAGIKQNSPANFMSIYPNPAHDLLIVQPAPGEKLEVEITNLLGQPLAHYALTGEELPLNISGLSNGLYFLTLFRNNTVIATQKVIKE